jgi:hypothetical protein
MLVSVWVVSSAGVFVATQPPGKLLLITIIIMETSNTGTAPARCPLPERSSVFPPRLHQRAGAVPVLLVSMMMMVMRRRVMVILSAFRVVVVLVRASMPGDYYTDAYAYADDRHHSHPPHHPHKHHHDPVPVLLVSMMMMVMRRRVMVILSAFRVVVVLVRVLWVLLPTDPLTLALLTLNSQETRHHSHSGFRASMVMRRRVMVILSAFRVVVVLVRVMRRVGMVAIVGVGSTTVISHAVGPTSHRSFDPRPTHLELSGNPASLL